MLRRLPCCARWARRRRRVITSRVQCRWKTFCSPRSRRVCGCWRRNRERMRVDTLRRQLILLAASGALLPLAVRQAFAQASTMNMRAIPSTGEMLPVIGCGTWRTFDVGRRTEERAPLAEVLAVLFEAGGSVIDTSPMYGAAEGVVGDLLAAAGTRNKAFIAT